MVGRAIVKFKIFISLTPLQLVQIFLFIFRRTRDRLKGGEGGTGFFYTRPQYKHLFLLTFKILKPTCYFLNFKALHIFYK